MAAGAPRSPRRPLIDPWRAYWLSVWLKVNFAGAVMDKSHHGLPLRSGIACQPSDGIA